MNVKLFGGLRLQNGDEITQIARIRERTLFAYLLLHPSIPHTREKLIELLWPENESERSGRNFANVLYRLQQVVGKDWFVAESGTLALRIHSGIVVDVWQFDRLRKLGDVNSLAQAIALYSADALATTAALLPDLSDDWVLPIQTHYHESFLATLQQLATRHEQEQRFEPALDCYQRLRLNDSLNEDAYAGMMRMLARLERLAETVECYRQLERVLKYELNVAPSSTLQALLDTLQRTPAYVEANKTASSAPHPTPVTFSTTADSVRPLHNLPKPLTKLIGRKQELDTIGRLLANKRLITLTGAGGSGKTRLAIECGRQLADTFEHGACWVDLSALSDGERIVPTLLDALGVKTILNTPPLDPLIAHLRPLQMLIILDNCEHLLAACAHVVEQLLQQCEELQVLATSREPLNLAGEVIWLVPTLAVPEDKPVRRWGGGEIEELLKFPAVQLFVERAQTGRQDFVVSAQNAGAVGEICRRLDGIPLAIELAAARVKALSVQQIAQRLDDRFRLLNTGNRTALPRQQTLLSLIEWSYHLLNRAEQQLLRHLSVFAGGFSLEAAEAICGEDTLEWLSRLVDKSLVVFYERQGEARYRLLETIGTYAGLRLAEAGERDTHALRHATYYVELAMRAEQNLTGKQQSFWINTLEREHDNLRAALHWSLESQNGALALRITRWLGRFWFFRGYYDEGLRWLRRVLEINASVEQCDSTTDLAKYYARSLFHAGRLSRPYGNYAVTNGYFERSLAMVRQQNDLRTLAVVLNSLGVSAMEQNQFAQARTLFAESLAVLESLGNVEELSNPLLNLSQIAIQLGHIEEAYQYAQRTLTISRNLQDQRGIAFALEDLANAVAAQGDLTSAQQMLEESLTIHRVVSGALPIATVLNRLAEITSLKGAIHQASQQNGEAIAMMDQAGVADMIFEHGTQKVAAYLALAQGDLSAAKQACQRSLRAITDDNALNLLACGLVVSAAVAAADSQQSKAIQLLASATTILQQLGIHLFAFDQHHYQQTLDPLCTQISDAEFDSAWQHGTSLTMPDAVKLARR